MLFNKLFGDLLNKLSNKLFSDNLKGYAHKKRGGVFPLFFIGLNLRLIHINEVDLIDEQLTNPYATGFYAMQSYAINANKFGLYLVKLA